ncbi:hypothetical protein HDU96_006816 [Phlyctochytrium bullatum]|nr:hypothetical protein HDU96_006816 [Phlyctochytrium bullatum]
MEKSKAQSAQPRDRQQVKKSPSPTGITGLRSAYTKGMAGLHNDINSRKDTCAMQRAHEAALDKRIKDFEEYVATVARVETGQKRKQRLSEERSGYISDDEEDGK